jgi:hypothetical protein
VAAIAQRVEVWIGAVKERMFREAVVLLDIGNEHSENKLYILARDAVCVSTFLDFVSLYSLLLAHVASNRL